MKSSKSVMKLVTEYDVTSYACGLRVGDRVELTKPLVIFDHTGKPTGHVRPAGEVWTVLHGAKDDPGVVWFRQSNGECHTWTDDAKFVNEWFRRLSV